MVNEGSAPLGDRIDRALPYLATAAIVIGFINFFWFIGETISMGDAAQGRIVDGHYFLGNKGTFTEVSKAAWDWSMFHGASIFITHPLALASMFYLTLRKAFPAQMAGSVPADSELGRKRIELVRSSGPVIIEQTMGGRVGPLTMTAPLLKVWVHPMGMIVRAMLGAEHAILAFEILAVRERRGFLRSGVEIPHLGLGSKSPLVLYRSIDDPIVSAVRDVMARDRSDGAAATMPASIDRPASAPEPSSLATTVVTEPAIPGIDPRLSTVLEVLGLAVGIVLIVVGVVWAIPKLGMPGLIWTAIAIAILAWNGSKFIRRHLRR